MSPFINQWHPPIPANCGAEQGWHVIASSHLICFPSEKHQNAPPNPRPSPHRVSTAPPHRQNRRFAVQPPRQGSPKRNPESTVISFLYGLHHLPSECVRRPPLHPFVAITALLRREPHQRHRVPPQPPAMSRPCHRHQHVLCS